MSAAHPDERRVVITGIGVICPLGNTPEAVWDNLCNGRSGVRPIQLFPADAFPAPYGGEAREFTGSINDFGPLDKMKKRTIGKGLKTVCREAQMGIAAAQLAMHHAEIEGKFDPERTGAVFGSDYMTTMPEEFIESCRRCIGEDGGFDYSRWATHGMAALDPLWLLRYLPNMPAAHLSMYNDLRGPNNSLTEREASSNLALGEAARIIARGHADCMIAGATGTWVHPMKTLHAHLQFELADGETEPEKACRPFDLNRRGTVVGEGAAALVLEELGRAQERGATIFGEVLGSASSQVASRHLVADRRAALRNVMVGALRDAALKPEQLGHIHAHGLGTVSCDLEEAQAIHDVFGPDAQRVPVVAAKSYFGNLGAGSGVVEAVTSLLALQHNALFPILNLETPDPECNIRGVREFGTPPGDSFLSVNVNLQGQAAGVVIGRFQG